MKTINCHTKNNIAVSRLGLGAMSMDDLQRGINIQLSEEGLQRIEQAIPKEYASNSTMLPVDLDENGLFKF